MSLSGRSLGESGGEEKISKWLVVSFVVHGALIASMFLLPLWPTRRPNAAPVYTVDLVGGERIGGMNLGTDLASAPRAATRKPREEVPAPLPEKKPEAKKAKAETPEKPPEKKKTVEKKSAPEERVALKQATKPDPVKVQPPAKASMETAAPETKTEAKTEKGLSESAREKLIQAALERIRDRAGAGQKESTGQGDPISSGDGEGIGAAAIGPGGRGGGVAKGIEFIAYQNRMLSTIKQNWAWVGQKGDLKVVVRFGIKETGEIVGLKIVQASGNVSFDQSVLRAVRKSNPLPAVPESLRRDFADIELTFRPKDLEG